MNGHFSGCGAALHKVDFIAGYASMLQGHVRVGLVAVVRRQIV
jgi:hypothetical protein